MEQLTNWFLSELTDLEKLQVTCRWLEIINTYDIFIRGDSILFIRMKKGFYWTNIVLVLKSVVTNFSIEIKTKNSQCRIKWNVPPNKHFVDAQFRITTLSIYMPSYIYIVPAVTHTTAIKFFSYFVSSIIK